MGRWKAAPFDVQEHLCSQVNSSHVIPPAFLLAVSNLVITDTKTTLVLKSHLQNGMETCNPNAEKIIKDIKDMICVCIQSAVPEDPSYEITTQDCSASESKGMKFPLEEQVCAPVTERKTHREGKFSGQAAIPPLCFFQIQGKLILCKSQLYALVRSKPGKDVIVWTAHSHWTSSKYKFGQLPYFELALHCWHSSKLAYVCICFNCT